MIRNAYAVSVLYIGEFIHVESTVGRRPAWIQPIFSAHTGDANLQLYFEHCLLLAQVQTI